MIKQFTLILLFKLLFINNVYAYNLENNCEKAIKGVKTDKIIIRKMIFIVYNI